MRASLKTASPGRSREPLAPAGLETAIAARDRADNAVTRLVWR
jgi:hypothetical protein